MCCVDQRNGAGGARARVAPTRGIAGGSIHVKDVDSNRRVSIRRARGQLPPRSSCLVDDVQLLRRSLRTQSPAEGGDGDPAGALGEDGEEGPRPADHDATSAYQSDNVGNATRLIDLARSASGQSAAALASTAELRAAIVTEWGGGTSTCRTGVFRGRGAAAQQVQGRLEHSPAFVDTIAAAATEPLLLGRVIGPVVCSEHRWKEGLPMEEEAIMMLN
ncbi:hypothetical protein HRG_014893 [Hirsutella rhossiliensis]